jgi:hypothetical protein
MVTQCGHNYVNIDDRLHALMECKYSLECLISTRECSQQRGFSRIFEVQGRIQQWPLVAHYCPRHWGVVNEPFVVASMVHPDRWSIKAHPRALVVLGGGGWRLVLATKEGGGGSGVCHQGGVGPWASCLILGSPTLGSCRARRAMWLSGLDN